LTELAPVPALVFGDSTLASRWRRAANDVAKGSRLLAIEARTQAMGSWREAPPSDPGPAESDDTVLVANAAALPGAWLTAAWQAGPSLWAAEGRIAGARLRFEAVAKGLGRGGDFEGFLAALGLRTVTAEARFLSWPWELMDGNPDALSEDLAGMAPRAQGELHRLAAVYEPERVSLGAGSRVDAYAVLDARGGPIQIGPDVTVLSHTVVQGPCVVGASSRLLGGFVGRSTIGPGCRVAGEVDSTVWQGWANKAHHGFVGHSVIGEWVNLGALTTTSDLKNNYGTVRVPVEGREVESGLAKVGSFLGPHVKTGIGTLLPTGGSVGTGSNLFGGGRYAPRHVPAFGWWDGEVMREHRLDRFLKTAQTAMARRGRPLAPADEAALRSWFESTREERCEWVGAAG